MTVKLSVKLQGGFALVYSKRELKRAMRRAGADVANTAKRLIRTSARGGRQYGKRFASQPGNPPANQTGELLRSIKVRLFKSGEGVAIRSNLLLARILESGSRGGGPNRKNLRRVHKKGESFGLGTRFMAPRPFLTPALEANEPRIAARIKASLDRDVEARK